MWYVLYKCNSNSGKYLLSYCKCACWTFSLVLTTMTVTPRHCGRLSPNVARLYFCHCQLRHGGHNAMQYTGGQFWGPSVLRWNTIWGACWVFVAFSHKTLGWNITFLYIAHPHQLPVHLRWNTIWGAVGCAVNGPILSLEMQGAKMGRKTRLDLSTRLVRWMCWSGRMDIFGRAHIWGGRRVRKNGNEVVGQPFLRHCITMRTSPVLLKGYKTPLFWHFLVKFEQVWLENWSGVRLWIELI